MKQRKRRSRNEPGDIVAYNRRPRAGEILCHNHIMHTSRMQSGQNGFRWFVCRAGGSQWKECPCGWRPALGVHYADPHHVKWTRKLMKKLGSQEAFDRHIAKRIFPE
jgi:hypothetical protein